MVQMAHKLSCIENMRTGRLFLGSYCDIHVANLVDWSIIPLRPNFDETTLISGLRKRVIKHRESTIQVQVGYDILIEQRITKYDCISFRQSNGTYIQLKGK